MIGWAILTISSLPFSISNGYGLPLFLLCTLIIALGAGGIKSIVSPMAAEQFSSTEPEVRIQQGKRVVIDPDMSVQHLYNWFYWAINIGALLGGILAPKLEQHFDFWAAFLFPTFMFILGMSVFVSGKDGYVKRPPEGSVVLKAWYCFVSGIPNEAPLKYKEGGFEWDVEFAAELRQTLMGVKGINASIFQFSML